MSLEGKTVLVTGGSRGIGRAISMRMASHGAKVYINYVSRSDAAEETKVTIEEAGGIADVIGFDIANGDQVQQAIKAITEQSGSIEILVNNAGITRDGLIARMKESDWEDVFSTNLKGAFFCSKTVSKGMMKQRWGRIINITSVVGFSGNAGQSNYAATKAGIVGFSKSLAREYASRNITVNCVAPGYIETDMTEGLGDAVKTKMLSEIPMGNLGTSEDVAAAVAFLASEEARYITGQTIHVNGGMYM